jgi:hypothetical protein
MNSAMPARIIPASNRFRKDAGRAASGPGGRLGGPGGSSTPIPIDLRGGAPIRAEDDCGSSSSSQSRKWYGIRKDYAPGLIPSRLERSNQNRRKTASTVTHAAIGRCTPSRAGVNFQPRTVSTARASSPNPMPLTNRIACARPSAPTRTCSVTVPCTLPCRASSVYVG